jgi:hypothetical protein
MSREKQKSIRHNLKLLWREFAKKEGFCGVM